MVANSNVFNSLNSFPFVLFDNNYPKSSQESNYLYFDFW
jgi:hypothetical protein